MNIAISLHGFSPIVYSLLCAKAMKQTQSLSRVSSPFFITLFKSPSLFTFWFTRIFHKPFSTIESLVLMEKCILKQAPRGMSEGMQWHGMLEQNPPELKAIWTELDPKGYGKFRHI